MLERLDDLGKRGLGRLAAAFQAARQLMEQGTRAEWPQRAYCLSLCRGEPMAPRRPHQGLCLQLLTTRRPLSAPGFEQGKLKQ